MSEELEQALRRALRRREGPGEEFAARVISRLDASEISRARAARSRAGRSRVLRSPWLPAALAACLIAAIGLIQTRRHSLAAARAIEARTQLLQALSIASQNVNIVRAAIAREENPDS
jgi:hypothetical protein